MSQLNKQEQALIEAISKDCKTPAKASEKLKKMFGGLLENILEAALDEHLGYEKHSAQGDGSGNSRNGHGRKTVKTEWGEAEISVPRDRNSSFEPQVMEKRQTRTDDIENRILTMYAKGMSTSDIYGMPLVPGIVNLISFKQGLALGTIQLFSIWAIHRSTQHFL